MSFANDGPFYMERSTNPYGRGAEIRPESNEDLVRLEDSFPNGQLSESIRTARLQEDVDASADPSKRKKLRKSIQSILRQAAARR